MPRAAWAFVRLLLRLLYYRRHNAGATDTSLYLIEIFLGSGDLSMGGRGHAHSSEFDSRPEYYSDGSVDEPGSPCGGAPQQRGPLTPQTQTRPNRLHTHTHPPKRLAHPRSPRSPLSTLTSRATHAHPTSPRSTGFCVIWDCISSSSP